MRRVLHIVNTLDDSGAANQLCVLVRELAREGFDVQIATLDSRIIPLPCREGLGESSSGDASHAALNSITSLGRRWNIDPLTLFRLRGLIRHFRPDIVHTWNLDAAMYGGAAVACRARRQRLLIGLNRIEPWAPGWQWFVTRQLARHANRLVTSSPNVSEWYVARGLPADRFTVIPAGVAAARPSDVSREELLRELQLPADARLIGVVGRLVPENRVKDLIWAADLLRVLHNNLRLLVVGDGPMRSQLEEYARLASDLDHIRFLGAQIDAWRIMPHLDVLWNASENGGHSTAILESMAAGVPVVASDTPTNRELVIENETGYLIPLGTRAGRAARARVTDRVFTDAELRTRLSRGANRHAAEQFGEQRWLQNYSELYAKIC